VQNENLAKLGGDLGPVPLGQAETAAVVESHRGGDASRDELAGSRGKLDVSPACPLALGLGRVVQKDSALVALLVGHPVRAVIVGRLAVVAVVRYRIHRRRSIVSYISTIESRWRDGRCPILFRKCRGPHRAGLKHAYDDDAGRQRLVHHGR
jgi:hypothetical protein